MTAPVPAGPTDAQGELREALTEVVRRWWGPGAADPRIVRELADAVLALRTVRDALAAQETLRQVQVILGAGSNLRSTFYALRRTLAGNW